jgi:5-methylcytosine-specific restriction endonuclease McrA
MPNHIQRLKIAVEEWLIRNELDMDTIFYDMDEWRQRKEDFLNDADLILVFEGGLYTLLNYNGDTEEFDDYIESFGYYYEMGHSWNMGFYPIPDYDYSPVIGSYSQKLRDPRWQKKSQLVKVRANFKCQDCNSTRNLETHHCYYSPMRERNEPWEYPLSALRCLCRSCHEKREKTESRIRAYMARLRSDQIDKLKKGLDDSFYWFEDDAVIDLLSKLGRSDEKIYMAIGELLKRRNDINS